MTDNELLSPLTPRDNALVTVSNGSQFRRVPEASLREAQADGFYRPNDHGLAIVGNGELVFEIPDGDVEAAGAAGYRDIRDLESTRDPAQPTGEQSPVRDTSVATESTASEPATADIDSLSLLDGLSQAEQDAEAARLEQERVLAKASGWRWYVTFLRFWLQSRRTQLVRQLSGGGISVLIHVAMLLILASLVLATKEPEKLVLTASASATDDVIEEIVVDQQPLDITEPTEETQSEAPPEAEAVAIEMPDSAPDFLGAVSGDAIEPPAMPSDETGQGEDKPSKRPTFFGSKFSAINYVFVIDNSNSMIRGRFETALNELMLTVNKLTPRQRFFVIFYSDTAYPMMHPRPVKGLVAATPQNKLLLFRWLQTVELCLKTNGKEALQAAFDLEPDVIYVLGDGAFTDRAAEFFAQKPHPRIIVHTRGMEVKPKDAESFRLLAESNRGTYMDVGVAPEGAIMAKQFPRRRNNVRGPIWGITLPIEKK